MPRVPLSRRLLRNSNRDKIVELRLAGQPWRVVAATVGLSEITARKLFAQYYHANGAKSHQSQQDRKNERRDQLELLDGLVMRLAMDSANPKSRATYGYSVRDFLGAVESSRRVKQDLTKLDGLEGVNPSSNAPPPAADGTPQPELGGAERRTLIIRDWIDGLRERHPRLYAAFVTEFGEESPATVEQVAEVIEREGEADGSELGSDPARDADAAIEPAAPDPPADS